MGAEQAQIPIGLGQHGVDVGPQEHTGHPLPDRLQPDLDDLLVVDLRIHGGQVEPGPGRRREAREHAAGQHP